jgi:hypothetical protein
LRDLMLIADFEAEIVNAVEIAVETVIKGEVEAEIRGNPILGFTDKATVKIDFDNKSFKTTKYWAFRTLKRFKLRGFIILKSSEEHYHMVFDRRVSWLKNMGIVGWVAVCSRNSKLKDWLAMQCIKGSSTLRVAPKGDKPSPRVVFRYGSQDHQIKNFLKYRKLIKRMFSMITKADSIYPYFQKAQSFVPKL